MKKMLTRNQPLSYCASSRFLWMRLIINIDYMRRRPVVQDFKGSEDELEFISTFETKLKICEV